MAHTGTAARRCLLLAFALPGLATASPQGHGPHVHGLAHLQVALAGADLEILFRSPAANIIGFEHAPATAAERGALASALERFRDAERMLRLDPAAECSPQQARVEHTGAGNADAHDHQHEHGHEHDSGHGPETDAGHSEIHAHYRFVCRTPQRLQNLSVELLQEFPGIETLDVQVVTPERQYGMTLSRDERELAL